MPDFKRIFAKDLIFCVNTHLCICKITIVEHIMGTFKLPKNKTTPIAVIAYFLKCIFKSGKIWSEFFTSWLYSKSLVCSWGLLSCLFGKKDKYLSVIGWLTLHRISLEFTLNYSKSHKYCTIFTKLTKGQSCVGQIQKTFQFNSVESRSHSGIRFRLVFNAHYLYSIAYNI